MGEAVVLPAMWAALPAFARTAALARLKELQPENSIAWIERNIPYTPGPMAKFLDGMRKAGLE